jgi:excisionase family DNA binding protein
MSPLSTEEVAQKVGIHRVTLEHWLSSGKVESPRIVRYGKNQFRNWTPADVDRIRKYKQKNYRKGRGRKPKPKR